MTWMSVAEVLTKAREWLLEHEWVKGNGLTLPPGTDTTKKGCAWTACREVAQPATQAILAGRYLAKAVGDYGPGSLSGLYRFNDAPETTFNDVLAKFDEAILLAKEDGEN